jgi:hypothetical protein
MKHMTKGTVKLQQLRNRQIIVSIPVALTTALTLKKGDLMVWKVEGNRLYLDKAAEDRSGGGS